MDAAIRALDEALRTVQQTAGLSKERGGEREVVREMVGELIDADSIAACRSIVITGAGLQDLALLPGCNSRSALCGVKWTNQPTSPAQCEKRSPVTNQAPRP